MGSTRVTSFIKAFESEYTTFGDTIHPLATYQQVAFDQCCALLREQTASTEQRSRPQQNLRLRARTLLCDIFATLGAEVFFLCTLAAPITKLSSLKPRELFPELLKWQRATTHQLGLTQMATDLCNANSIKALVASSRKRERSENNGTNEPSQHKRVCRSPDFIPQANGPYPHVQFQHLPQPRGLDQGLGMFTPYALTEGLVAMPQDITPSVLIRLKLSDLLKFFQEYETDCPDLEMICPLDGMPAHINLESSPGLSAKLELSLESSEALLKNISSRAASTEVS